MKRKIMIIIVESTICLSSFLISNVENVDAPSGNINLNFGDVVSYESSNSLLEYVRWEFECSNGVNIMDYMATADDFDSWNDASFYLLSSGSTSNSGKFNIPREDSWVIFFMHSDLLHPFRTASVYVSVTFSLLDAIGDSVDLDRIWEIVILIAKIAIPIIVGLILLRIIVAIVRSFKQKKKATESETFQRENFVVIERPREQEITRIVEEPTVEVPQEPEVQDDNIIEKLKYCTECGTATNVIKKFCSRCGKEFKLR